MANLCIKSIIISLPYSFGGSSDLCQDYQGAESAISVFEVVPSPQNYFYPFQGLRTRNAAVEFCETQGGPDTRFGRDDDGGKTDGKFTFLIPS